VRLGAGDLVMLPRGPAHILGDRPDSPVTTVIAHADLAHRAPCPVLRDPVAGAVTTLVCGTVRLHRAGEGLLDLLPPVLHVPADRPGTERLRPVLDLLADETAQARPGTAAMVARLCDLLLVEALRVWLAAEPAPTGWPAGLRDPRIAAALGRVHAAPEEPWTVHTLARVAGMSRSRFAERFTALVGQTPMGYLTAWRLGRAADLLDDPAVGLATVARRCGYGSEAAFGKAFKRRYGTSPGAYRDARTRIPDGGS
jgi:AraC-like DNA-binding protein